VSSTRDGTVTIYRREKQEGCDREELEVLASVFGWGDDGPTCKVQSIINATSDSRAKGFSTPRAVTAKCEV
jgi:hypothetical protein